MTSGVPRLEDLRAPERSLRGWWQRMPVDAVAFLAIAVAIIVTQDSLARRGLCFDDPSWYFHFGHRTALGDAPYRDYVFHGGPLPIYVDALSQGVFRGVHVASLHAAMLIKILRVFVAWAIARRLAGIPAALALSVFCALDPLFGFAHHASSAYTQLFISLGALWLLHASRGVARPERTTQLHLALAGLSAALVASVQPGSLTAIAVLLGIASAGMTVRKEYFTRSRLVALWLGFAAGIAVLCGALALAGALGPALQQMVLDTPPAAGHHGVSAVVDALSGGALGAHSGLTGWGNLLLFLGLPMALVIALLALASRDRPLTLGAIGVAAVPIAIVVGLMTRHAQLDFLSDVPRTLLAGIVGLAIAFPARLRAWLGIEPLVAIGLGGLPLASDWAREMALPGRGSGDPTALVVGAILLILASRQLAPRGKAAFCAALALVAITGTCVLLRDRVNPFAADRAADGTLDQNTRRSPNHRLRGMKIRRARTEALAWLGRSVPPGSTCFIDGNLPVLYTLLSCHNPTRLDLTAAGAFTELDARDALAALRASPPDYLITQHSELRDPPPGAGTGDDTPHRDDLDRALHRDLHDLFGQYEPVGTVADALSPDVRPQADPSADQLGAIRVYRRTPR